MAIEKVELEDFEYSGKCSKNSKRQYKVVQNGVVKIETQWIWGSWGWFSVVEMSLEGVGRVEGGQTGARRLILYGR